MKKLLISLSLLALMGAGCANSAPSAKPAATNPTPSTAAQNDGTTANGQPLPPPPPVTVGAAGKDGKPSVQIETNPVPQQATDGSDVPVTDIYLGEPQEKYDMQVSSFMFTPNTLTVKHGDAVQLTFTKVDGTHTFVIDGTNANFQIAQGDKDIFTAPAKPGSYQYYCSMPGHKAKGMVGTLIVK